MHGHLGGGARELCRAARRRHRKVKGRLLLDGHILHWCVGFDAQGRNWQDWRWLLLAQAALAPVCAVAVERPVRERQWRSRSASRVRGKRSLSRRRVLIAASA